MHRNAICIAACVFCFVPFTHGAVLEEGGVPTAAGAAFSANIPLAFVENQGQWDTPARFVAWRGPMVARFEARAIVLQLQKRLAQGGVGSVVVRMTFDGACEDVTLEGAQQQSGRYNFFLGNERLRWRTEVPAYSQVLYRGLYDNVDMGVREVAGRLEYDLLLAPGADLSQVSVRCEGIDGLDIGADGSLVMQTALGPIVQKPPVAWYETPTGERTTTECRLCMIDQTSFGFDVPELDSSRRLVIDPELEWSTFLGGTGREDYCQLALGADGTVTVVGITDSSNFPTVGAYDPDYNGVRDAFVARFDPSQGGTNQLVWATFLGGAFDDEAFDLVLDDSGVVTLTGRTSSVFPTTLNAYDPTPNGGYDAFVARLDPSQVGLAQLVWSTYLGGSLHDRGTAIAMDDSGIVTVAGFTSGGSFPTTPDAYDPDHNGGYDVFVARLDPVQSGTDQLLWSTFLGGSLQEGDATEFAEELDKMDIALDALGQVTLSGGTFSQDFPTTVGAYDTTSNGGNDGFISRLSADGADLLWSTYLGGSSGQEPGIALAVDESGVVTVAGYTWSLNFPITPGSYDTVHSPESNDGFVARLDPSQVGLAQLVYSTFVGGDDFDPVFGLALDSSGVVTAVGYTASDNFPTTPGAFDTTYNGGPCCDAYVVRLRLDGNGDEDLVYGTYLGASDDDWAYSLALINANDVYVTGGTTSAGFPDTAGAYDESYNGDWDGHVFRLDLFPADINDDGTVGIVDLLALLAAWGPCPQPCPPSCPADIDGDCAVGILDLLLLLARWS